jgi:hypothetical protein
LKVSIALESKIPVPTNPYNRVAQEQILTTIEKKKLRHKSEEKGKSRTLRIRIWEHTLINELNTKGRKNPKFLQPYLLASRRLESSEIDALIPRMGKKTQTVSLSISLFLLSKTH